MKRIYFLFLCFVMTTLTAIAGNPLTITGGSKSLFHEEATLCVVIDDHKTIIDKREETADVYYGNQSAKEYEDFVNDVDRGHESFITYFNEKRGSKIKVTLTNDSKDAKYTLRVTIDRMNVGNGGGVVWGMSRKAGGAVLHGTMVLVDNNSGEVLCEMKFQDVKGMMSPVFRGRIISAYRYLADALLKVL